MIRNKMDNERKLFEEQLKSVVGGDALEDFFKLLEGLGLAASKLKEGADTNTCPLCNAKIIPGAEKCTTEDILKHVNDVHNKG